MHRSDEFQIAAIDCMLPVQDWLACYVHRMETRTQDVPNATGQAASRIGKMLASYKKKTDEAKSHSSSFANQHANTWNHTVIILVVTMVVTVGSSLVLYQYGSSLHADEMNHAQVAKTEQVEHAPVHEQHQQDHEKKADPPMNRDAEIQLQPQYATFNLMHPAAK